MAMTVIGTIVLPENEARTVYALIIENPALFPDAVDLYERAPGLWDVVVYLSEADAGQQAAVAMALGNVAGPSATMQWTDLPATDWVRQSQAALPPVRVGRVLVYGGHHRDKVRPNDIAIEIEAGQAFGTGHHATTQGCLHAIQAVLKRRVVRSALDIGTGSGVLAIALARQGVGILATDIDPLAIAVARDNAAKNGAAERITFSLMPKTPGLLPGPRRATYDLVVANILMGPLLTLAPAIARAVAPNGSVILSGLLPPQRSPIIATYRALGLHVTRWLVMDGWLTVMMTRPKRYARSGG
jgi:ribosomal protein L11 methyltransferase